MAGGREARGGGDSSVVEPFTIGGVFVEVVAVVRLVELTGHAHGQLGLLAQTGAAERKLLVADACWLSEGYRGCREPHLLTRFLNESTPALRATLKKLHDVDEQFDDLELLPTHCPEVFARYGREEDHA